MDGQTLTPHPPVHPPIFHPNLMQINRNLISHYACITDLNYNLNLGGAGGHFAKTLQIGDLDMRCCLFVHLTG